MKTESYIPLEIEYYRAAAKAAAFLNPIIAIEIPHYRDNDRNHNVALLWTKETRIQDKQYNYNYYCTLRQCTRPIIGQRTHTRAHVYSRVHARSSLIERYGQVEHRLRPQEAMTTDSRLCFLSLIKEKTMLQNRSCKSTKTMKNQQGKLHYSIMERRRMQLIH